MPSTTTMKPGHAIPRLTRWGRSADADLVFRTLASFGAAGVEELSRDLGLARVRVRAALDELHAAEIAAPHAVAGSRTPRWRASPPDLAIARLDRSRRTPAVPDPAASQARALATATGGRAIELGEGICHLPSREQARRRLGELIAVERREHLAMNPEHEFDAEAARTGLAMFKALLARGVTPRTLGVMPSAADGQDPTVGEIVAMATNYRRARHVAMKLFVIDRRTALFPVAPSDPDRGYLEVSQPALVESLVTLFERAWSEAPTTREPTMPTLRLTPREHTLLGLLSAGHTDESAARQMSISPRTVTNTLRGLMDRLGVENRFQLGLALGAMAGAPRPFSVTIEDKDLPPCASDS